jgi:hypothetical protein
MPVRYCAQNRSWNNWQVNKQINQYIAIDIVLDHTLDYKAAGGSVMFVMPYPQTMYAHRRRSGITF